MAALLDLKGEPTTRAWLAAMKQNAVPYRGNSVAMRELLFRPREPAQRTLLLSTQDVSLFEEKAEGLDLDVSHAREPCRVLYRFRARLAVGGHVGHHGSRCFSGRLLRGDPGRP